MSRKSFALLAVVVLASSVAPRPARAHGVVAQVDRRDGSVAVRLRYHGGRPLADASYEVRSPRGGETPFAEGRTDPHGWVAFTPDVAGTWKVRIADASGHGRVVDVEVDSVAAPADWAPLATTAAAATTATPPVTATEESASVPRILATAAAIAAAFGLLFAVQRARRAKGP